MELKKAQRRQAKLRLCLQGPSGSGKTYSSLLVAQGLCQDWSKIVVVDTENHSAELYSHLGEYNSITLEAPFTPEKFISAIKLCEKEGMEVIILDSISHTWDELLDFHSKLAGNSFTNWGRVTPRYNAFVQAILQSSCHVISTIRSKQEYVLSEKNGKQVPEKVGMKGIQRDEISYEFTLVFDLDSRQQATASKDRTSLFIGKLPVILSCKEGEMLKDWCNQGDDTLSESEQFSEKIKLIKSVPELRTLYLDNPKFKDSHNNEYIEQKNQLDIKRAKTMYNNLNTQKNGTNLNII